MNFKKLELNDKPIFEKYFAAQSSIASVNDFVTIYCWNVNDKCEYAIVDDVLIIRTVFDDKKMYYCPLTLDNRPILPYIQKIKAFDSEPHNIVQVLDSSELDNVHGYKLLLDRDYSDYVYDSQSLITLSGKKLHAKRNHINKFNSLYKYTFRDYTDNDYDGVLELLNQWRAQNGGEGEQEQIALLKCINNYKEFNVKIGVIEIEKIIRAFAIVSISVTNVGQVQFEKADISFDGIYAAINNFAAKAYLSQCKYINRQEDMGIEGLRKSKLSYHPEILLNKYRLKSIQ